MPFVTNINFNSTSYKHTCMNMVHKIIIHFFSITIMIVRQFPPSKPISEIMTTLAIYQSFQKKQHTFFIPTVGLGKLNSATSHNQHASLWLKICKFFFKFCAYFNDFFANKHTLLFMVLLKWCIRVLISDKKLKN